MIISSSAIGSSAIGTVLGGSPETIVTTLPSFSQVLTGNLIQVTVEGSFTSTLPTFSQSAAGRAFIIVSGNISNNMPTFTQEGTGEVVTIFTGNIVSSLPTFFTRQRGYINTTPPDLIIYSSCLEGEILEIPKAEYTCQ